MSHLSVEAKEAIVLQALNRDGKSLETIALTNNISESTLYKWLKRYRDGQPISRNKRQKAVTNELSRAEQFDHVLATHDLDEVSLGKYCRERGLYSHQINLWRETLMTTPPTNKNSQQRLELKKLKDENRRLQKELRRKDKALAEASALLILKKKADLIWGVDEDD